MKCGKIIDPSLSAVEECDSL